MARNYLFAALALFTGVAAFWAERFAFIHRVSSLAEARFDNLHADIQRLDDDVAERNRNGDFFRFMGVRAGGNKVDKRDADLRDLNRSPDLVESAIILDKNFITLARSGRDLADRERSLVREKKQRSNLAEGGLLRRHDVTDFTGKRLGHVVFIVRPDLKNTFATLFASTYDFTTVAAFSRDVFNAEEKKLIGVLLSQQTRPERSMTVRGNRYLSLRRTWLEENMILFQVSELPPLYTYLSLYFSLLLMIAALVGIMRAHMNRNYTRREISERILAAHTKALHAQSGVLGELEKLGDVDREKDVTEKLASQSTASRAAAIEAKIREGRTVLSDVKPPQPAPLVIDVMSENRQFRFMNPALTKSPRPIEAKKLGEREQKLRERAFSDELKTLMAAMASPAGPAAEIPAARADLTKLIDDFQESYRYPDIDQYIYYLNELYFDEVSQTELAEAMRVAGDAVQSRDFAVMLYDPGHAVFKTGLVFGAPDELSKVFYLLPKDSVLPNDLADYSYIEITQNLRKNPYFKKRFPAGFSETLKGIHIFTLAESFIKARVVFFDSARGGALTDTDVITTVKSYLRQIAPAIQMFFIESDEETGNPRDLADWAVRELKESIALTGEVAPFVSQFVFETSLPLDQILTLMREISEKLIEGEKILLLSPSHLVVVHAEQSGKAIEDIVGRLGMKFIIKESEFGKTTRNLYTFIEF
jgi:hypothetical protein